MTVWQTIHDKVAERLAVYQQAALAIHAHPETSNHEYFAQETLTKLLADDGFTVTKDVAGHPDRKSTRHRVSRGIRRTRRDRARVRT